MASYERFSIYYALTASVLETGDTRKFQQTSKLPTYWAPFLLPACLAVFFFARDPIMLSYFSTGGPLKTLVAQQSPKYNASLQSVSHGKLLDRSRQAGSLGLESIHETQSNINMRHDKIGALYLSIGQPTPMNLEPSY
ncbi:hypothetical protein R3P38DRAFT_2772534 [Favolaschia claudopus]|uniref:Uncharacterized protein n=1 Tax=Favolaschia claudopus TaxID=2862362 RepID=A0AAW0C6B1_9AGAR